MPSSLLRRTLPALLAAAALSACGGGKPAANAIPQERFVEANVALRLVQDTMPGADSLRAAALRKHRVTAKDLRAFVAAHEPEYLAETWKTIAERVDSLNETARLAEVKGIRPSSTGQAVIAGAERAGGIQPLPGGAPPPNPGADPARRRVRLPSAIYEQQQPNAPRPAPALPPDGKPTRKQ